MTYEPLYGHHPPPPSPSPEEFVVARIDVNSNFTNLLGDNILIASNSWSFAGVLGWCWHTAIIRLHDKLDVILTA